MIELYKNDELTIFYTLHSQVVLATTDTFKSEDNVWTGNVVKAFLVQHDKDNHLLPKEQWYWKVDYPVIYEYNDGTPIAVWISEVPFNGYTRYDWEEYHNGMK